MDRWQLIDAAFERRNWSPVLRDRMDRLLTGAEDRQRLRCCSSGCAVCVEELRRALNEVESGLAISGAPGCHDSASQVARIDAEGRSS